ncbi:MAG TPA: protein kinase, partial [Candidatus Acidoferrales bacterium]|nr:protein kinase [Candidatus Acidoferrales bacterium]
MGRRIAGIGGLRTVVGQTLGHYRIIEKIGAGGMGEVHRARDTRLDREVAIKILPAHTLTDDQARKRFQKEAKTLSKLNHPHIATIHDFDSKDGVDFIVMELVAGDSLEDKLKTGPLSEKDIARLGEQMASALEEAHEHGIIHRDLKPANIRLTPKGQAKILDFGVASLLQPAGVEATTRSFTETQALAGTLPYMSPEQLRGESIDGRSDIYSLGVVLFEMSTGQRPYQQKLSTALSDAILHEPPPLPRAANPRLSPALENIILKCLEKDRDNRYQSVKELAVDLRRLGGSEGARVAELRKSVAVLYFENLSRSEEDEYFRDGMTEDIITELAKIKSLQVFPRAAVVAFRDKLATAPEVGEQLTATHVLGGSLRRAGNRLRITVQMVETRTGHSVWAERYDREMKDVFEVQEDIARCIAQALRISLSPQEEKTIARKPTENLQAYDFFLRGRNYTRRQNRDFALQMFEHALQLDPDFALAHAGIANVCGMQFYLQHNDSRWIEKGIAAVNRAFALDPQLPEAFVARARICYAQEKYDEAVECARIAIARKADCESSWDILGRALFVSDRWQEAADLVERALEANGDDYNV